MMKSADIWDRFLALVSESTAEWAKPEDDTDAYRKGRALKLFNASCRRCARPWRSGGRVSTDGCSAPLMSR